MKCETLTYSAYAAGYSVVCRPAPSIMGRSSLASAGEPSDGGGVSSALPGPLSHAMLRLWLWAHFQISGCVEKAKDSIAAALVRSRIFELPCSDPEAIPTCIKVNRSMLRKLKRLERLGRAQAFETLPHEMAAVEGLSPTQYLEYMIRHQTWSRAKVYGLGPSLREKIRAAMTATALRGSADHLARLEHCAAPISPD